MYSGFPFVVLLPIYKTEDAIAVGAFTLEEVDEPADNWGSATTSSSSSTQQQQQVKKKKMKKFKKITFSPVTLMSKKINNKRKKQVQGLVVPVAIHQEEAEESEDDQFPSTIRNINF